MVHLFVKTFKSSLKGVKNTLCVMLGSHDRMRSRSWIGLSLYMSEQTVLELDWDVEVTDCCDAGGKSFLGRMRDEEELDTVL